LDEEEFRQLLNRVRLNDEDAAAELVRRYEPEIRTMVRAWLRPWEMRLRKVFDSNDICQSVLAWFFLKDATARYDLASQDNLRRLFLVMVRNRVFYHARQHRHDQRVQSMTVDLASPAPPPDEILAERELLDTIYSRLSAEEADVMNRRLQGASWDEVATALGGTPDGRRMQLARATGRLAHELAVTE
jgi:RNA polymerase sigma-70 factor (ECF subfamily)